MCYDRSPGLLSTAEISARVGKGEVERWAVLNCHSKGHGRTDRKTGIREEIREGAGEANEESEVRNLTWGEVAGGENAKKHPKVARTKTSTGTWTVWRLFSGDSNGLLDIIGRSP